MTQLLLRELHQARGAHFFSFEDAELVLDYGDVSREYHALTSATALLDFSFRGRLCLLGGDRLKFLHGQVTNDIKDLPVGGGCYAALVNSKARMQADLFVYNLPEELLLDFEPGLSSKISSRLEKYIIADDVQVVDVAPHFGLLTIQGPAANQALTAFNFPLPGRKNEILKHEHPAIGETYLANNPRLGSNGFDLFISSEKLKEAFGLLAGALGPVQGALAGWSAFETARIEAAIPRFGADMDETNLPPEAGLDKTAISYTKGCYIGQEIIARIRTYGQVSKSLRLLRLDGPLSEPPPKGTKLLQNGKEKGYLTSSCWSPKLSSFIALGYVRREGDQSQPLQLSSSGDATAFILPQPR